MNSSISIKYLIVLLIGFIICLNAEPEPKPDPVNDGKYRPRNYNKSKFNDGKYVPTNEASISIRSIDSNIKQNKGQFYQQRYNKNGDISSGKYVHKVQPYVHVHDNRELGRYVHIHIPYNGGYGPYSGDQDRYRYLFDNRGDYSLYTTTTTTTQRPRTRYDDEGKWRIIRQEEKKNQKKYDYLYLTENGIYAEEQASLFNNKNMKADGTHAQGYYEYTGDDGKLYKVEYTVGEQGFVPMGDHIPTPPPIPIEIQRALEYVANKKRKAAMESNLNIKDSTLQSSPITTTTTKATTTILKT